MKARKVIIFREPNPAGYGERLEYIQGNIRPLAFPDVEISLEKVFSGQIWD